MSIRFYEFGPFRIDKLNHVLLRDGATVPLKPKVFDTLVVLVESRDRVLDKNELMSRLWPDTIVEEANLSQNIYLLRKVLGEGPQGKTYITTHPKRGYRFVANVREIAEPNTGSIAQVNEHENASYSQRITQEQPLTLAKAVVRYERQAQNRRVIAVAFILCFLGLSLTFTLSYFRKKNEPTFTAHDMGVHSLAVLPFKRSGSDAINEMQSVGLADTLITRLSNTSRFVVRSASAGYKFRSRKEDPVVAGRELQVDAVLDVNVQRVGNKMSVTMQLVRVSDGLAFWAGKFDAEANDLLAVQDRLLEQLVPVLIPRMTSHEQELFSKRHTENSEAYQFYMLGRYYWSLNRADGNQAVENFNKAIEKDPNYALAHVALAEAHLTFFTTSEAPQKAKQAILTALSLDNRLVEAHVLLGRIKAYYEWDWIDAEGQFKKAIELNPNSANAHSGYAGYLTAVQRNGEAIEESKYARRLDPLSELAHYQVLWALTCARYYDDVIAQSEQLNFPYAHFWIGHAYLGKRKYDKAIAAFQRRLDVAKYDLVTNAYLGHVYALSGRRIEAEKVLTELKTPRAHWPEVPYLVAIVYAGLNDKDQTFSSLEKAFGERSSMLAAGLKVDPVWDNVRSDPRFADLLRRVGLPQ